MCMKVKISMTHHSRCVNVGPTRSTSCWLPPRKMGRHGSVSVIRRWSRHHLSIHSRGCRPCSAANARPLPVPALTASASVAGADGFDLLSVAADPALAAAMQRRHARKMREGKIFNPLAERVAFFHSSRSASTRSHAAKSVKALERMQKTADNVAAASAMDREAVADFVMRSTEESDCVGVVHVPRELVNGILRVLASAPCAHDPYADVSSVMRLFVSAGRTNPPVRQLDSGVHFDSATASALISLVR